MNLTIEHAELPVGKLKHHPRNPRLGSVDDIASSIQANGLYRSIVVQRSTMYVLAGNHTLKAAKRLKMKSVPVGIVDVDDETALRIVLVDNKSNDAAAYDEAMLAGLLQDILTHAGSLSGTGYAEEELLSLLGRLNPDDDNPEANKEAGKLLALLNITIAEPRHQVENGEEYILGGKHRLIVAQVADEHSKWSKYLTDGTLFAPHAGPAVAICLKASSWNLVIVQPDTYIAGHILDRYEDINGKKSIKKAGPK